MHPIQTHPQKTLTTLTTLGAASLGLSALILAAAGAAAQSDNALTTPTRGSTFDYAWDYGQIDRFTVLSAERELKLRAPDAASYRMWMEALEPIVGEFDESTRGSLQRLSSAGSVATEPSKSTQF